MARQQSSVVDYDASTHAALALDRMATLAEDLKLHRGKPPAFSRSAKLFAAGFPKMARKVVEEAAEVAIEAMRDEPEQLVSETADLLYQITVLLTAAEIDIDEVWAEMDRRRAMMGLAEKLPK